MAYLQIAKFQQVISQTNSYLNQIPLVHKTSLLKLWLQLLLSLMPYRTWSKMKGHYLNQKYHNYQNFTSKLYGGLS